MPIKSYITFPQPGKKHKLIEILKSTLHCDVLPAENKNVLVLVTDTKNEKQEELLQQTISKIEEIDHLTLVSGFKDDITGANDKATSYDE